MYSQPTPSHKPHIRSLLLPVPEQDRHSDQSFSPIVICMLPLQPGWMQRPLSPSAMRYPGAPQFVQDVSGFGLLSIGKSALYQLLELTGSKES